MKKILKELIKEHFLWILVEIVLIGINIYLLTVPSKILGQIIDFLNNINLNKSNIVTSIYALLGICILIMISRIIWKMIDAKIARNIVKKLQDCLFEKLLKTDVSELQSIKNGDIMSHFVRDIRQVQKFVSNAITLAIRFILNFTIIAFSMVKSTNIKLTAISLSPIVISIFLIFKLVKKLEKNYNLSRINFTNLSEFVQESTDSIRTTKAYVGEKKQYNEFLNKNTNLKNTNFQVIKNETLLSIYTNLGIGIGTGLSILYGSSLVLNNIISLGDFVAFNGYMLLLQSPIMWIPWVLKNIKKVQVSYKRLDKMFNLKEEICINDVSNREKLIGNIEIKNLTYNYPGCVDKVLENINISIKSGKSLGIIGVLGSGKTTLMNLLLKLYEVPNGKIYIDGKDINDIKTDEIRNNICYITQDNFLFSTTLKKNINLFRDIYDDIDILESTKLAMIYEEIENMSDGINTIIGEKGIDLSGGQKQRAAVARAIITNPELILADEPTGALDSKTGQELINILREICNKGKTIVIVTHDEKIARQCDRILCMKDGNI